LKKILLIASIVLFSITSIIAQEINFGVKGGVSIAQFGGDRFGFGSFGTRTGFHIGGLVEIPLMENISLQPELLYSMKGSNWSWTSASDGSSELKMDYIDIPLMGKYHLPFVSGLSAEAGPVFGVWMSAKSREEDVKDSFKTLGAAFAIGATYKLNMGVFFSLRYNKGLLDVWDDNDVKNQNNVFQVSAGYMFK